MKESDDLPSPLSAWLVKILEVLEDIDLMLGDDDSL